MTWLSENSAWVIPLVTGTAAGLAAAVRALWIQLVTAPKLECAAERAILRQERDDALKRLDEERRDHLTTLRLTERLSRKLESVLANDSSRPPSS